MTGWGRLVWDDILMNPIVPWQSTHSLNAQILCIWFDMHTYIYIYIYKMTGCQYISQHDHFILIIFCYLWWKSNSIPAKIYSASNQSDDHLLFRCLNARAASVWMQQQLRSSQTINTKHILFMKSSWSKQTAPVLYFMTAFDSGCDSLSLRVSADRRGLSVSGAMWTISYSILFICIVSWMSGW